MLYDTPKPPRRYTTAEAATVTRHRPQTYRREYCLKGHFHGVRPVKLPGGRLLWPADEIDGLARGEVVASPNRAAPESCPTRSAGAAGIGGAA